MELELSKKMHIKFKIKNIYIFYNIYFKYILKSQYTL